MVGGDVEWCVEGPAGGFGAALLFMVSWWWSGCRHSVVTSVMAARVEDSSTIALPADRDRVERTRFGGGGGMFLRVPV